MLYSETPKRGEGGEAKTDFRAEELSADHFPGDKLMTPEAVRSLQVMLNQTLIPSPGLRVDGIFGPKTRAALHALQRAQHAIPSDSVNKVIVAPSINPNAIQGSGDAERWMIVAEGELGQSEIAGTAANPRIIAYHSTTSLAATSDEVPWCSSFVNWVMKQAGYIGTRNALARSWLSWGVATTARYGAITVIHRKGATSDSATGSRTGYHVAFFVSCDPHHISLLGGNQSDMVKVSRFNLGRYNIEGYRWPF